MTVSHTVRVLLGIGAAILLLVACSEPDSPERRIRAMLSAGEAAVESSSQADTGAFISQSYKDRQGRGRRELMGLLSGYFLRHGNLHLLVQIDEIMLQGPEQAEVALYAALAGRRIGGAGDLSSLRADLYRLELSLREEEGEWRVVNGAWRPATRADFLQ